MANRAHLRVLRQGVNVWNTWRRNRPTISPDLSGADLTNRDLTGANLANTNLNRSNVTHANLTRVDMVGASLDGTIGLL